MHTFRKRTLAWIILGSLLIMISACFCSCTSTKQDQNGLNKSDRKSLSHVLGKEATRQAAYKGLYSEFPCANDSTVTKTQIQQVIQERPVPVAISDSNKLKKSEAEAAGKIIDHFHTIKGSCKEEINAAFNQGVSYASEEYQKQKDTLRNVFTNTIVTDKRLIETLKGKVDSLTGANNQLYKEKADALDAVKKEHKRGNKFLYILIGIAVMAGLFGAAKLWRSFSSSPLKILK